eukprot:Skav229612  [mRNA]  locus=scaffold510:303539:304660:- [translate_table: standard]
MWHVPYFLQSHVMKGRKPTQNPELMSYLEYLEQCLPGKAKETKRGKRFDLRRACEVVSVSFPDFPFADWVGLEVWKKFTEPGQPGELLRPQYENMAAQLQSPGRMVGTGMVLDPQCLLVLTRPQVTKLLCEVKGTS